MSARVPRAVLHALTLLAVATIAVSSLTYFDFWWYLKSGEQILAEGRIPTVDVFSFTAQGRPWVNHMWATQLLFLGLWKAGGPVALILLKAAVVTATFGILLLTMRRRGVHPIAASLVLLLAAGAGWEFWDVRPQIWTYLLLAVFLHLLRAGWEGGRRSLVWLPLLMVLWANLHAGFVVGIAVVGLVGVGTALPRLLDARRRSEGWRVLALAAGLAAVTGLASLVNPYGVRAVMFPLEVVHTRLFMSATVEWYSPNFHNAAYRGFELMLLGLVPAFAWGRARLSVPDVLIALTFGHLALGSARHIPLFAVAVAPLLADALEAAARAMWARRSAGWQVLGRLRGELPSLWPVAASPVTPVVVVTFFVAVGVVAAWGSFLDPATNPFLLDLNEQRYPERTMAFIKKERLPAPLFNAYAWGGYELWRLYPEYRVFIDGRTHVYGPEVLQDFVEVATVGERWQAVLDKWKIQTILTERRSALTQAVQAVGGWRLVFAEREAAVFVRETGATRALLARLEPVTLSEPPRDVLIALAQALGAAEAGDDEAAIRRYQEIMTFAPDHPVAVLSLAILREKQGQTAEARRLLMRLVDLAPDAEVARHAKARLDRLR